jgi:hypothetical protein
VSSLSWFQANRARELAHTRDKDHHEQPAHPFLNGYPAGGDGNVVPGIMLVDYVRCFSYSG